MNSAIFIASLIFLALPLINAGGIQFNLKKEKVKSNHPTILNDMFSERLGNKHDVIYKGEIYVGTPAKKFNVIFDTGSGLFWLPMKGCASAGPHTEACKNESMQYDPAASSTGKQMNRNFSINYGTGSASGSIYRDVLRIGPAEGKQLVMNSVPFGAATNIKYIDHGIIGLSLKDSRHPKPVFMQAVDEGLIEKPWFTTFMKKCEKECEDGGTITLGGFDDVNCQEPIHWAPVETGTSMWRFRINAIEVNNSSYARSGMSSVYYAITDTGTSYIQLPTPVFTEVIAALHAEKRDDYYMLPCDSKFSMSFTINGKDFHLSEREVLLNQGYGDKCVVAIGDAGKFDMFLLGDAFNRGHCQVYDIKEKRVGFAKIKSVPIVEKKKRVKKGRNH